MASASTSAPMAAARDGMTARALRYFSRATSSRPTPSYERTAAHAVRPGGTARSGAGFSREAQAAHGAGPGWPHTGQLTAKNTAETLRTACDTFLGDVRRHQPRGRDVEGPVLDRRLLRCHPGAGDNGDLFGRAALDGDGAAVSHRRIERRAGRGNVEGDPVVVGEHGEAVGPDLVGHVPVGGNAVGADD